MVGTPSSDTVEAEFARRLAGNEKKGRDRALKKLRQFLKLRSAKADGGFTRVEMLSIWKGLFYCMWMSDKPLVQEDLAKKISELMIGLPNTKTIMLYFDVFLETMQREWRGIDRLRMDKFYLLVRCMLENGFKFLQSQEWDVGIIDWMLAILKNGPICPTNTLIGMHYHMCDIYLEELAKVGKDSLSSDLVLKFLDPYCILITKAKNADLVRSAVDEVFQQLVENSKPALDLIAAEEEGLVDIRSHTQMQELDSSPVTQLNVDYEALAERLFELASEKGVLARNRKKAFRLVEKFQELAEGRMPLVDVPDAEYSSEDEVQGLQEHLTKEIISENTKELRDKREEKKASKRMKKRAKSHEMIGIEEEFQKSPESGVTNGVESVENGNEETQNEVGGNDESEETLPKKKRKKKRKVLELEETILSEPDADKPAKKKRKKKKVNSQTEDNLVEDGNGRSDDKMAEANGCEPSMEDSSGVELIEERPKKRKKKKKAKTDNEIVIVGSALDIVEDDSSNTVMDSTVIELTSKKAQKSKRVKSKKAAKDNVLEGVEKVLLVDNNGIDLKMTNSLKSEQKSEKLSKKAQKEQVSKKKGNMPDIVRDVAERERLSKSEVDVVEDATEQFALLRKWLDTGVKPGNNDVTEITEQSVIADKTSRRYKKKGRSAAENAASDKLECSESKATLSVEKPKKKEIEFQKFATICKVKPPTSNSSFVKFSAAKVSATLENRHLAAVKRKKELPVGAHSPKRVVFEMSRTQVQPFRKNEKAIACSPSPGNIAFDPKKTPDFGLLKRSKTMQKKRKLASDYF